jgi:hypothetical protein
MAAKLVAACAAHARLDRASLVLYGVSTLYFETDAADGLREPGFSKERRLDPQRVENLPGDGWGLMMTIRPASHTKTLARMRICPSIGGDSSAYGSDIIHAGSEAVCR